MMKLMRLNQPEFRYGTPAAALDQLRQEVSRLFEEPFGAFDASNDLFSGWAPPLDLSEDADQLVVEVELPGVRKEDLEVSVHKGVLTISGERKSEQPTNGETGCYRRERFHGRFQRSITLPKPVETDAVKATYRDGVLTITLPKTEEARPRKITVKHG